MQSVVWLIIIVYKYVFAMNFLNLGEVIWKCNVYNSIIPEKCKLMVGARVEVKLKKLDPVIWWRTLDKKVCMYLS